MRDGLTSSRFGAVMLLLHRSFRSVLTSWSHVMDMSRCDSDCVCECHIIVSVTLLQYYHLNPGFVVLFSLQLLELNFEPFLGDKFDDEHHAVVVESFCG